MTDFALVVAADEAGGIGKGGTLPWRLPGELAHFRRLTTDAPPDQRNAVIMGRRTWESIPAKFRPLPDRANIVVTSRSPQAFPLDVYLARRLSDALDVAESLPELAACFVIGGARLFGDALAHPDCRRVHLTRVEGVFDCDTFLPELGAPWERSQRSERHEEGGVGYVFEVWERSAR